MLIHRLHRAGSCCAFALAFLAFNTCAAELEWLTNYGKAKAKAKAEQKHLLLYFTGSDWCPGCIMVRKHVFPTDSFKDYARANLVLLEVDFPRNKPVDPQQHLHNVQLAKIYGVDGYPSVVLLSPAGVLLGMTPLRSADPANVISTIERLKATPKP